VKKLLEGAKHASNSFISLLISALLIIQPFCLNAGGDSFPVSVSSSVSASASSINKNIFPIQISLSTAAADGIVVDPSASAGNRATLDKAQNGVPVVNIVAPTAGGVSRSVFSEFNVNNQGVIMNNSLVVGVSQLGGALVGNPNFTGGKSAKIILNEVTGTNRSNLNGVTEIFGDKAAYVLANPNGISCNGCGFINTPRVTLSTGTAQVSGGNLVGFDVENGDVLIEGAGLNAAAGALAVDSFDIISRTAKIAADLHVKGELNVITGRNNVDYASKTAVAKADNGSAKPTLALDSSALGGMYAGKINFVATEAGVGVNTSGKLAASAGDVVITADGRIEYKSVNAKNNIKITSKNDAVKQAGDSYAEGKTEITAAGDIEISGGFAAAKGDVNLSGANINVQGGAQVLAGVDAAQVGNNVNFSNNGNGTLTANAAGDFNNAGQISASNLSLTTGGNINNTDAVIAATGALALNSGTITNTNGLIQSGGNMALSASSIDNNGTYITDANGNVIYGIIANGNLDISSFSLGNNNGAVVAGGAANLNIVTIDNTSGLLLANDLLTLNSDTVNNTSGLISSFDDMVLNAATMVNNYLGTIYASGDLTATNVNNNSGIIQTEGKISLDNNGAVLDNTLGNIRALGSNASITIGGLTNLFNLGGNIIAQANIDINVANNYIVNGDIITNDHVDITAWSVTNNATINAADYIAFTLTQGGFTNNTGAEVISNTSVKIDVQGAGNIVNNGEISAPIIDIDVANGNLNNAVTGVISSSGALDIDVAGSITNAGRVSADGNATIDSVTYNNTGQTASDDNLTITTSGNSIHNTNGGLLYATNDLILHTADLENNASDIFSLDGDITIDKTAGVKNTSVTNTSGSIEAMSGDIRIDTDSLINNRSSYATVAAHKLDSNGNIIVYSGVAEGSTPSIDFTGYSERYRFDYSDSAHDTFFIYRSTGTMGIAPTILAANDIIINAGTVLNDGGQIAAGRDATITAASVTNRAREASDWAYLSAWRDSHPGWYGSLFVSDFNPEKFIAYNLQQHTAPASISAGRNLTANVTNIDNATSYSGGALPAITASVSNTNSNSTNPNVSPLTLVDDGSVSYSNSAALDASIFAVIPSGSNGLFKLNTAPGANYLIETNVAFIDMNRFLGSNYFLTRIGYVVPNGTKLLGDAFYDTKLVRTAIFERTGQRYLPQESALI
jgi:filamentous hemagglutinin